MKTRKKPIWINARYAGSCGKCGKAIQRLSLVLWFPLNRSVYCEKCGNVHRLECEASSIQRAEQGREAACGIR